MNTNIFLDRLMNILENYHKRMTNQDEQLALIAQIMKNHADRQDSITALIGDLSRRVSELEKKTSPNYWKLK